MTKDATALLIERILSQLSAAGASAPRAGISVVSQADSLLGNAANYAQLISLPEGAAAQALADVKVGEVVAQTTAAGTSNAAGQSAALATAGAATIGAAAASFIGAAIVLVASFILAALTGSSDSASSDEQQLQQLSDEIGELENIELRDYWNTKLALMISLWSPLGVDLDNLASEGIGGPDVKKDVSHSHDDALAFVDSFIPSKTPGAELYWQRPGLYNQIFSAQGVYYPYWTLGDSFDSGGPIPGWYGSWPQGHPAYPPGSFPNPPLPPTADPRSMLPFLLLGIKSYLTIQSLVHFTDHSQPTFKTFLKDFQADLQAYASFLSSQYTLAINGIVKSDIPQNGDIMTFLCMIAVNRFSGSWPDTVRWGGSFPDSSGNPPTAGAAWNGVYGVVDTHPNYGAHQPPPPVAVHSASASYIVDLINTGNLGAELNPIYQSDLNAPAGPVGAPSPADNFIGWLNFWTIPWTRARVILGTMARWKAIYLINGYDKMWSAIQNLRLLSGQSLLPTPTLTQDGTIADGNWSARELMARISSIKLVSYERPEPRSTSLLFLVQTLDAIANGNWAGPPDFTPSGGPPARPLGFRDRLAAAAV